MKHSSHVKNNTMGIRGLHTCLLKTIPDSIQSVDWSQWRGKRLGIDIQCFLYRAIANQLNPLEVIANQIVAFRSLGITPVYVFDGKPPTEKDSVTQKRRQERQDAIDLLESLRNQLTDVCDEIVRTDLLSKIHEIESKFPVLSFEIKDEIKKFLYASGSMFVNPNCEADALLAYWVRRGVLDGVVSFDLDFIPRGCSLLVPKHISAKPGESWYLYDPVTICKGLTMNCDQFVDFCVLLGSDYTPNLPIVAWKTALSGIQRFESLATIWGRHTFSNWRRNDTASQFNMEVEQLKKAKAILKGEFDDPDTLMESVQWAKWNAGIQSPELVALDEFRRTYGTNWNPEWWTILQQTS